MKDRTALLKIKNKAIIQEIVKITSPVKVQGTAPREKAERTGADYTGTGQ
ncbi:MAG: hypothetical protein ACFFD4_17900 [Candidatus Odinarchaeota archaeon]